MSDYDSSNVFARILRDEIPSDRVYEDDEFIAFRDINPAAPTHIVLIPRGEPPAGPAGFEADLMKKRFGGPARIRTWDRSVMSRLL